MDRVYRGNTALTEMLERPVSTPSQSCFPPLNPFPAVPVKGSLSDPSVQSVSNPGCFFQRAKGALLSITAGQKVISKHKNGRFYQCEVVRLTTETFYEVNFDDGSFSDNLYPEDIVVMSGSSWGLG